MAHEAERMRILQMLEAGRITAADAVQLLNALPAPTRVEPAGRSTPPDPRARRWKNWWLIPFGVGVWITVIGGLLMFFAYRLSAFSLWFVLAALPFAFGVLVMAAAVGLQRARWLHVRVKTGETDWPRNIAISLPLPLGLAAWFLRTFGSFIPRLKDTGLDELILALGESTSPDNPLYVDVVEGEHGERVQLFVG